MSGTERRQLNVIKKPPPTRGGVVSYTGEGPVMKREGPLTWLCGGCREPILEGMQPGQVRNLVFRCNGCGVYNQTID